MNKELIKKNIEIAFAHFKTAISRHPNINKKRADGGWTVGEIGAHIINSTGTRLGNTKKTERPYDQYAAEIKNFFLNFQLKFPAFKGTEPKEKNYSTAELFSLLDKNKEALFSRIDSDDLTELNMGIEFPGWGPLTKYEWLVLVENHIIRHTHQVNEFNNIKN